MPELFIGLMSGTSVDAIDAVLMNFAASNTHIAETYSLELDANLRIDINQIIENNTWPQEINQVEHSFALASAEAVNSLLKKAAISPSEITAVGSHGQTIWHQPNATQPLSIQLGNPQQIANYIGIKTIGNFRQADIFAGGQGAPIACAYHAATLRSKKENRVILNLGGIANITYLPSDPSENIIGFDVGPANTLLDLWIKNHKKFNFDKNGEWARSGKINLKLLELMMNDPYFQEPPPKSTGREDFNLNWLQTYLDRYKERVIEEDIQATLTALTAQTIAVAINELNSEVSTVLVCGGGSNNKYLVELLKLELMHATIDTTSSYGVPDKWMEAMAFAWLAKQNLANKTGNIPSVTGANKAVVLGECCKPN